MVKQGPTKLARYWQFHCSKVAVLTCISAIRLKRGTSCFCTITMLHWYGAQFLGSLPLTVTRPESWPNIEAIKDLDRVRQREGQRTSSNRRR